MRERGGRRERRWETRGRSYYPRRATAIGDHHLAVWVFAYERSPLRPREPSRARHPAEKTAPAERRPGRHPFNFLYRLIIICPAATEGVVFLSVLSVCVLFTSARPPFEKAGVAPPPPSPRSSRINPLSAMYSAGPPPSMTHYCLSIAGRERRYGVSRAVIGRPASRESNKSSNKSPTSVDSKRLLLPFVPGMGQRIRYSLVRARARSLTKLLPEAKRKTAEIIPTLRVRASRDETEMPM